MQLRRDETSPECLMRFVSKVAAGALIVVMGFCAERLAGADSKKTVQGAATSSTTAPPRPRDNGIEGIVKDEKGQPIAGARVENWNDKPNETRKTLTDKIGHYALDDLHDSLCEFRVLVRAPGRSPVQQEVKPGPPGKPARVDFTLSPGHVLHGRVVNENGKPIAGVLVLPLLAARTRESGTQSDKDGRVEIDSLSADAKFQVSKFGYTKVWWVPLRLDSSGLVTVVLQPTGIIRGRVVGAEGGKPLEHFRVWLNPPRRGGVESAYPGGYDLERYDAAGGELDYPGKKFASSEGTFTLPNLTNKMAVEVCVIADGRTKCVVPMVVAGPADEVERVEFELKRIEPAKLATFSGRMLDHKGRPIRGTNLRLIISSSRAKGPVDVDFQWPLITGGEIARLWYCDQFLEAVSDSQGRFEFKDVLPQKHWQLAYWGPGVPQDRVLGTSQTAPGPAPPLMIKLSQPARVVVTINRVKYPEIWQVALQVKDSDAMPTQIDLQRRQTKLEIKDLAPGDYDLELFGKPDATFSIEVLASQPIHLKAGETKEVRF
jgi:Carboxypeptidase regulatory-like domain